MTKIKNNTEKTENKALHITDVMQRSSELETPYQINLQSHLWGDLEPLLKPFYKSILKYIEYYYGNKPFEDLTSYMSPLLTENVARELVSYAFVDNSKLLSEMGITHFKWIWDKIIEEVNYESDENEYCILSGKQLEVTQI